MSWPYLLALLVLALLVLPLPDAPPVSDHQPAAVSAPVLKWQNGKGRIML